MRRKKTVKRRDRFAAALADPRYRARAVRSVKMYSRKAKVPEDETE